MNRTLSLNNTVDIIANSIHLIQGTVITDILDIISSNAVDTSAVITALLANQSFIDSIAASATNSYTISESDNLYHSKTYLNNILNDKLDSSAFNTYMQSYFTQNEINALFSNYSLTSDITSTLSNYLTTTQIQSLYFDQTYLTPVLANKVETSTLSSYYTSTQVDTEISNIEKYRFITVIIFTLIKNIIFQIQLLLL